MKIIFLLFIFSIILIFYLFYNFTKEKCFFDFECNWRIINCCPEEAGALWECVNIKNFTEPKCPETILCPQVYSPKPKVRCFCKDGVCSF